MTQHTYWCELAFVGSRVESGVAVVIDDDRFASIAIDTPPPPDAWRLRGLTLPGLANVHSHAFHRALRSRTHGVSGSFWTWRELMYTVADRLDPESYLRLARGVFAEMAMAGITTVGEFHYLHHQRDGTPFSDPNEMGDALVAAAGDVGIRLTLIDALYLHGGLDAHGYTEMSGVQRRFDDGSPDAWARRVLDRRAGDGYRVGVAAHSIRAVDPAAIRFAAQLGESIGAPLHAHVSEQRVENEMCRALHGMTPSEVLSECGALGPRFTAVHGTHLAGGDIAEYASTGSSVCLCPTTERDLGDGIGPAAALAGAAVPLTLGTDSNAVIDMFEEMSGVEMGQRLDHERRGMFEPEHLLSMATVAGHGRLGWGDAGTLEVGKRADLVTVALDSVRTAGASRSDALQAAVFAATTEDVRHVVADGRVIVREGRHQTVDPANELERTITSLYRTR